MSSGSGVLDVLRGQARMRALAKLDALELKPGQPLERALELAEKYGGKHLPFIVSSDAHCPAELTDRVCNLKMGKPSFTGLRQIRFEPMGRVIQGKVTPPTHPRILGYQVDQGILQGVEVRLSPHLNVLIGGRGAGKSAVLDMIRFALGIGSRVEANEGEFRDRIKSFIGIGGEVRVFLQDASGQVLCAQRSADFTSSRSRGRPEQIEFDHQPKLYRMVGEQFIEMDATPQERFPIEFFAQGEVMELTRKADDQLAMLDEHVTFGDLRNRESDIVARLSVSASEILRLEGQIEELAQQVTRLPQLKQRISDLGEQLSNPVFGLRTQWQQEKGFIDWAGQRLDSIKNTVGSTPPTVTSPPSLDIGTPNPSITDEVREVIDGLTRDLGDLLDAFQRTVIAAEARYQEVRSRWIPLEAESDKAFREALRQSGAVDLHELHRESLNKQNQLECIESELEPQLTRSRECLDQLYQQRSVLVAKLVSGRTEIHETRVRQIRELSDQLRSIRVEIEADGDRREYLKSLQSIYRGSNIHNADSQLERIVERVLPHELSSFILRGITAELVAATDVTSGTAAKIINHPPREAVLDLQVVETPSSPTISWNRGGNGTFAPLHQLSIGERCSVILSIALLEKSRPLIIDQPEDDLDDQFVVDDIVAGIKRNKETRQLLVATHNPNIPVLGDAEMVMRVAKKQGEERCHIVAQGSLEDDVVLPVVLQLEGGAAAFELRRDRYMSV